MKSGKRGLSAVECVLITCVSFTAVSLLLSLISAISGNFMALSDRSILELLTCTGLIGLIMFFTSKLPLRSAPAQILVELAVVAAVILGVGGGAFGWFPWQPLTVLFVCGVFIAVFAITYLVMLLQNKLASDQINRKIQEKRHEHD